MMIILMFCDRTDRIDQIDFFSLLKPSSKGSEVMREKKIDQI